MRKFTASILVLGLCIVAALGAASPASATPSCSLSVTAPHDELVGSETWIFGDGSLTCNENVAVIAVTVKLQKRLGAGSWQTVTSVDFFAYNTYTVGGEVSDLCQFSQDSYNWRTAVSGSWSNGGHNSGFYPFIYSGEPYFNCI